MSCILLWKKVFHEPLAHAFISYFAFSSLFVLRPVLPFVARATAEFPTQTRLASSASTPQVLGFQDYTTMFETQD